MVELSDMIRQLRRELNAAMSDGRDEAVRFELGPVEIEATVTVDREAGRRRQGPFLGRGSGR